MPAIRILLIVVAAGTMWAQAPAAAQPSSITIHTSRSLGEINPLLFGHFTEETLTSWEGGVSSQLLADRKFSLREERDPHSPMMTGVGGPWRPVALAGNVTLVQDRVTYYSAPMSERITNYGGEIPAGVEQSGFQIVLPHISRNELLSHPFHFRAGQHFRARIAIKDNDLEGDVFVGLGSSYRQTVALASIPVHPGGDWQIYDLELTPSAEAADGKFMVYTRSRGTIWIDSASLVLSDLDDGGLRRDVIAATRSIVPANIRWPGGWFVSDYHWQDGIGPVDRRPADRNRAWGAYYNNDIGVDEYLAFCEKVGATPYIVVNVGSGTPAEAAALVEYVNGPVSSTWGKRRAANGHAAPYGVNLWNIGNEEYLPTLGGTSATGYVENYLAFARAMKAADSTIRLVAVGAPQIPQGAIPSSHPLFNVLRYVYGWNDTFLPAAGKDADFYSFHYYEPGDSIHGRISAEQLNYAALTLAEHLSAQLAPLFQIMDKTGRRIPIALDEWSVKMPDNMPEGARPKLATTSKPEQLGLEGSLLTLRDALSEAGVYNLMQRRPGDFGLGSRTLLFAYQVGLIGISRESVVLSPSALMLRLFSTRKKMVALDCDVTGPTFDLPAIETYSAVQGAKFLDVSARALPAAHQIEIFVLNRNVDKAMPARLRIDGTKVGGSLTATVLNAADLDEWNSFSAPDTVTLRTNESKLDGGEMSWTFAPHSLTKFVLSYK